MLRSRVVLADDHAMFREGLALLLVPTDLELVAAVSDGRALLDTVLRLQPDLAVIDLTMPEMGGLEVLRALRPERLRTRFVVLTVHADAALAAEAIRAGARGYVVKHAAGEELLQALRQVMLGGTYVSPLVSGEMVRRMVTGVLSPADSLTPRQREVLRLLAEGRRVKEIAARLGLSVRTVETHKYGMMHLLEIDNTVDLVKFAIRQGIITA